MSVREPVLGLDLGSSNACVAAVDQDGNLRLFADAQGVSFVPTLVCFHEDENVLVGVDARAQQVEDPDNTVGWDMRRRGLSSVKTRAGEFTPVRVATILLDHLRRQADAALEVDSHRVILTVPAGAQDGEREDLLHAAAGARLEIVGVLPCAVAAAYAYGLEQQLPQPFAVCDLGANHFECAVLCVRDGKPEILGFATSHELGGRYIDGRIVDLLVESFYGETEVDLRYDEYAMRRLFVAAEQAKRQLAAAAEPVQIQVPDLATSADGNVVGLSVMLSREELWQRMGDLVEHMDAVCRDALGKAGLDPGQMSQLLLVGGGVHLPVVRDRLANFFGRNPRMDVDPEAAVALGAALYAPHRAVTDDRITGRYGSVSAPPPQDTTGPVLGRSARVGRINTKKMFTAAVAIPELPPDLQGLVEATSVAPAIIEVLDSRLGLSTVGGFCDEIIPSNAPIPAAKTRVFGTGKDNQRQVQIHVCQGDSRRYGENAPLGTIVLEDLAPRPRGQVRIAVTFSVDDDGVLEASARDEETGKATSLRIQL